MPERSTWLQQFGRDFQARQGARMRLPLWLRLVMPIMALTSIFALTALSVAAFWLLHRAVHPATSLAAAPGVTVALIVFPSFVGAIAPALMLLNLVLVRIPPLKRMLDKNAEGVTGASYQTSMKGLWKFTSMLVPPALILALIGAVEPWAL